MDQQYVVAVETGSNQQFIFTSNRLRENVGSSELVRQASIDAALAAAREVEDDFHGPDSTHDDDLASWLLAGGASGPVEFAVASSGRTVAVIDGSHRAEQFITAVTGWAAEHAPGLEVFAVKVAVGGDRVPARYGLEVLDAMVHAGRLGRLARACLPPATTFPVQLPIARRCRTTATAAHRQATIDGVAQAVSRLRDAARAAAEDGYRRIRAGLPEGVDLPEDLGDLERMLEEETRWIAIVHADGNQVGQVLKATAEVAAQNGSAVADYVDLYRRLSVGLAQTTVAAYRQAMAAAVTPRGTLPVIPLILGGDDLTAVVAGPQALAFTEEFLKAFEEHSGQDTLGNLLGDLPTGRGHAQVPGRMTASAGVVFTKPHYPFHASYQVAEGLTTAAKAARSWLDTAQGAPWPALDFHVLYDTAGVDLTELRARRRNGRPPQVVDLWGGPYLLDLPDHDRLNLQDHLAGYPDTDTVARWARPRSWRRLSQRAALVAGGGLPRTVIAGLRTALTTSPAHARRAVAAVRPEYRETVNRLTGPELIRKENGRQVADLLDVVDAADFVPMP